jgi:hypothetical protein
MNKNLDSLHFSKLELESIVDGVGSESSVGLALKWMEKLREDIVTLVFIFYSIHDVWRGKELR